MQVQACNNGNISLLTNNWLHIKSIQRNLVSKPNKGMQSCEMLHRIKVIHDVNEYTQFCRIKGCCGAGCPPPPPNNFRNVLISRFYEQFSRSSGNLGHFWKFEKNFKLLEYEHINILLWSAWSGDSKYINCFAKYLNFRKIKAIMNFAKF